jgi:PhnB protein
MQFQPYLTFDGNCEEAMRFYERVLGGQMQMMMKMKDAPQDCGPLPEGAGDRIMHACLVLDGSMLMASDSMPGQPFQKMAGFGVAVTFPTVEAARNVFDAFAEGGDVMMPFGETFWAEAFGGVTDRFGTPWMINGGPKQL